MNDVLAHLIQLVPFDTSSSSDDNGGWLLLAGPIGAAAFYFGMWRYYRNTDKSNQFEKETAVELSNLVATDQKVGTNNRTRDRWVKGRNSNTPRVRVGQQQVPGSQLLGMLGLPSSVTDLANLGKQAQARLLAQQPPQNPQGPTAE